MVSSSPWPIDCSACSRAGPRMCGMPLSMNGPSVEWQIGGGEAVAVGEQLGRLLGEGEQFARHLVDMGTHGGGGAVGVASGDGVDDGLVLGVGVAEPARGEDQEAGAVEIGAGIVDHRFAARRAQCLEQDLEDFEVVV